MPGTKFYRALATLRVVRNELLVERDAHNAMKLCFKKIHESLDMYQGHYINRLRFHLNRHHTEYLRKVRVMRKEKSDGDQDEEEVSKSQNRRSARVGIAADLANEVEQLKKVIMRKDLEIERLAMLLDDVVNDDVQQVRKDGFETEVILSSDRAAVTTTTTEKPINIKKLTNPYYPSDDEETYFSAIDARKAV
jgi:hypothetical protein